jgi:hypothetical protein
MDAAHESRVFRVVAATTPSWREGPRLKSARTDTEIAETLQDVQVTLDVVVEHLGLRDRVRAAIEETRAKAERSRVEIERSLGYDIDPEGESRR